MKELGKHDFEFPQTVLLNPWLNMKTFSVGIFQWIQAKKGLKKSKVKYRVKGLIQNPSSIYDRARIVCDMMDRGHWVSKKKSETV